MSYKNIEEGRKRRREYAREQRQTEEGRKKNAETAKRYRESEKGKKYYIEYWKSERGKEINKKYRTSSRGKKVLKRAAEKHEKTEARKEYKRKYYLSNKEHIQQRIKKYNSTERAKTLHSLISAKRRARKYGALGSHTIEDWLKIRDRSPVCPACSRFIGCKNLHKDHTVPLSKGGSDSINNIQSLCKSCNSSKNNKSLEVWLGEDSLRKESFFLHKIVMM